MQTHFFCSPAWQPAVSLDAMRNMHSRICSRTRATATHKHCCSAEPDRRGSIVSRQEHSRRAFLRLSFATAVAVYAGSQGPEDAFAICGEPDPFFAHYLEWTEGLAEGPNGRSVHYRCVGSGKKEKKAGKFPVVYIGDAGVALASGETLELLGESDRRIIFADLLGVGDSDSLPEEGSNLDRAAATLVARDEVLSVLRTIGIGGAKTKEPQPVHIVASGFGLEVTNAILTATEDAGMPKKINLNIASVAAEGWSPIKRGESGDITFAGLQGTRVCAIEGAHAGNISILRKLYEPVVGSGRSPVVSAIENISKRVPTLGLRTYDTRPLDESVTNGALFTERVFSQAGRLAHLVGTEDTMKALDEFFAEVEVRKETR